MTYFYSTLAPYGGWVNLDGYGWCWRPTTVAYNSGWQPYCNNGYWVYSNCGWYWVSGYSWGWATFHYGRWFCHPHYGWCWWPDTTWAPSWVCWRYNQDYCGWAPLPPHAVYQSGVGFVYQGHAITAGFSFGLNAGAFTFVATKNFCDPHLQRYRVDATEGNRIFNQTMVVNNINFDSHRQGIVNAGVPPKHITAVTRQEIHPVTIRAGNGSPVWGGKHEQFALNGTTLIVNRPQFVGSPVLTLHPGTTPVTKPAQSQIQPVGYGNGNYSTPHPVNPGQNAPPRQNFNRTPPRVPQTQQPGTIYVAPSAPRPTIRVQQHRPNIINPRRPKMRCRATITIPTTGCSRPGSMAPHRHRKQVPTMTRHRATTRGPDSQTPILPATIITLRRRMGPIITINPLTIRERRSQTPKLMPPPPLLHRSATRARTRATAQTDIELLRRRSSR